MAASDRAESIERLGDPGIGLQRAGGLGGGHRQRGVDRARLAAGEHRDPAQHLHRIAAVADIYGRLRALHGRLYPRLRDLMRDLDHVVTDVPEESV